MQNLDNKIIIIDFDDSFTYNISEVLFSIGVKSRVINYRDFFKDEYFLKELVCSKNEKAKVGVILGPGPGHPSSYSEIKKSLIKLMTFKNVFMMGICLGHQLLWHVRGEQIIQRSLPNHGNPVTFTLPDWDIFKTARVSPRINVQQYNSLCLKESLMVEKFKEDDLFSVEDELLMSRGKRYFSMQFHPESVGTSFQRVFFGPMLNFLYN